MIKSFLTAFALLICAFGPATAENFYRVTDKAEFVHLFAGKTLSFEAGAQVIRANGKVKGTLKRGGGFHGVWALQAGMYCRNLVFGGKETGTDCLTVEVDGANVRMVRNQGRGEATFGHIN